MATLKVTFKAIDEISSKFDEMTRSGERAKRSRTLARRLTER